jgi:hypothetical protein
MDLRVTYADGSGAGVTVSAPDFVAFESEFNRSVAKLGTEIRFTDICWLAWHRLKRAGETADFDMWLNRLDGVEIQEAAEPVPLGPSLSIS